MTGQDKFSKFVQQYPHDHRTYFNRPHVSRRHFFQVAGAGVAGSFLAVDKALACTANTTQSVTTQNRAKNVIFILLAGAPSHTDTFDLKVVNGTTPAAVKPAVINGINWPTGLMPQMAKQLGNIAIVRSVQSWALVHSLAQRWSQIGRNPAAALGDIAPNIGSIVALETAAQRLPNQVFPAFLALNSAAGADNGYLPSTYAPFRLVPQSTGIPNTTSSLGQPRYNQLFTRVHQLDDSLRANSPLGVTVEGYDAFYAAANNLMYNPVVQQSFSYSTADSTRYGGTSFGNACLIAKQVLAANQGTRFIQITLGNWDMHQDIYGAQDPKGNNLFNLCPTLDGGVGALLTDLAASGLLNSTMVVMTGEFGRTTGPVTAAGGRDHLNQQSILFAGAGIRGGRAIGATNADGSETLDFGWSRKRYIKPEDVEATIYSAMGINWTTVRCDDPFHRGFEYVPFSGDNLYGPIDELWM